MPATKKCRDDRVCMFQEKDGTCSVLSDTYKKSGDCPFCKEKLKDIGHREKMEWLKAAGEENNWQREKKKRTSFRHTYGQGGKKLVFGDDLTRSR